MRTCTQCGESKPVDAFGKSRVQCKACLNAKQRQKRRDNPDWGKSPNPHVGDTKLCTRCEIEKPVEDFRRGQGYRGGIRSRCKVCEADRLREWREANPERRKAQSKRMNDKHRMNGTGYYSGDPEVALRRRNAHLIRKYGITLEQEAAMRAEQGGGCAACGEVSILHVDHCHDTGEVRGLLCDDCNRSAGAVGDSAPRLRALADYLDDPPARAVLGVATDR